MCEGRKCWHEAWMNIARGIAKDRSTDPRTKVCAIIVPEDNTGILSLGYNGRYPGGPNEPESLVPGQSGFTHAEINCLIKAPYHYPLKKIMYTTHSPCKQCAQAIACGNIHQVIYDIKYRDTSGIELLQDAGIQVVSMAELLQ